MSDVPGGKRKCAVCCSRTFRPSRERYATMIPAYSPRSTPSIAASSLALEVGELMAPELDVSGGLPLEQRPSLPAVTPGS